jgi:glc operon protein GlcG
MKRSLLALVVTVALVESGASQGTKGNVTYLPSAEVTAAFEKGRPLVEADGYKVHAARRDAPGIAEVHLRDTDIFYVVSGSATIMTGGEVVDGKTTAKDEIRGASLKGGRTQRLARGDIMIIPQGVPHQFVAAEPGFLYYVVKATSGDGGSQP